MLDPQLARAAEEAFGRLVEKGMTEEEATDELIDVYRRGLPVVADELGATFKRALEDEAPRMLARRRRDRSGFERRLEWVWGDAIDALAAVLQACFELGESFNGRFRGPAVEVQDHRFEALTALHARACLVTSEIEVLLRSGFPFGARARWRTLHEIAVVAQLLHDGDDELSNRFLVHSAAEEYRDALLWDEHAVTAGRPLYDPVHVANLKSVHDAAVSRFGHHFAKAWRWADPLTAPHPADFKRLEKVAGMEHLRPDYREASHLLHGGSRGTSLGTVDVGDGAVLVAGPMNRFLAEPGHGAAISLYQATVSLVLSRDEVTPLLLSAIKGVTLLVDAAGDGFLAAASRLEELGKEWETAERRGALGRLSHNVAMFARRHRWSLRRRLRASRVRNFLSRRR